MYKLEIKFLKVLPMLLAFIYLINSVLSFFDIDLVILSYLGGVSLIPLMFIFLSSYVFKFCEYHRMFLYYIFIDNLISIYDYYFTIPLSDLNIFLVHMIIAGVSLFIVLYLYLNKG